MSLTIRWPGPPSPERATYSSEGIYPFARWGAPPPKAMKGTAFTSEHNGDAGIMT
jgi:hypothetical protein